MQYLERIVKESAAMGTAQTLEALGVSAGELSQRKARAVYGKWFTDAERAGRIHPSRVDNGRNGTRHYRVVEIQELRVADLIRAEIQTKTLKQLPK